MYPKTGATVHERHAELDGGRARGAPAAAIGKVGEEDLFRFTVQDAMAATSIDTARPDRRGDEALRSRQPHRADRRGRRFGHRHQRPHRCRPHPRRILRAQVRHYNKRQRHGRTTPSACARCDDRRPGGGSGRSCRRGGGASSHAFPSAAEARLVDLLRTSGQAAVCRSRPRRMIRRSATSVSARFPVEPAGGAASPAPGWRQSRCCLHAGVGSIGSQLVMQGMAARLPGGLRVHRRPRRARRLLGVSSVATATADSGWTTSMAWTGNAWCCSWSAGCLRGRHGTVRYADEFSSLAA
ncbi:MAG: hypothetical protein MZW92_76900 [Comamonadaceae bacterium]|nr:hypothetical protein [Comamonadaceae bacterium]